MESVLLGVLVILVVAVFFRLVLGANGTPEITETPKSKPVTTRPKKFTHADRTRTVSEIEAERVRKETKAANEKFIKDNTQECKDFVNTFILDKIKEASLDGLYFVDINNKEIKYDDYRIINMIVKEIRSLGYGCYYSVCNGIHGVSSILLILWKDEESIRISNKRDEIHYV
jgi:hypothetical protein